MKHVAKRAVVLNHAELHFIQAGLQIAAASLKGDVQTMLEWSGPFMGAMMELCEDDARPMQNFINKLQSTHDQMAAEDRTGSYDSNGAEDPCWDESEDDEEEGEVE